MNRKDSETATFGSSALSDWGGWRLNTEASTLDCPGHSYWVELPTCTSPAEVLDWIAQIRAKSWADDRILAGLIRALDDIFYLQGNLCPGGEAKHLSRSSIEQRLGELAESAPASHLV